MRAIISSHHWHGNGNANESPHHANIDLIYDAVLSKLTRLSETSR
jgi:hypothetical protein